MQVDQVDLRPEKAKIGNIVHIHPKLVDLIPAMNPLMCLLLPYPVGSCLQKSPPGCTHLIVKGMLQAKREIHYQWHECSDCIPDQARNYSALE
jgi:hypothetical protein